MTIKEIRMNDGMGAHELLKKYLRPYRKQLIIGPIFKLLEAVFEILIPTLMVYVIDIGVAQRDRTYIYRMLFLMLGISVLGLLSALICQYSASIASQGFGTKLRNAMFEHITGMPNTEINRFGSSSLVNRITNDVNVLQQAVAMLIRLVIRAPFIAIGSLIMAMLLDFKLAMVILLSIPLLVLVIYFVMSRSSKYYSKAQSKLDGISLVTKENLSGVRVIRSFDGTERETERFEDVNGEYLNISKRVSKISSLLNPMTTMIMNVAIIAILYFGGVRVNSGGMTQGEIIAFINYIAYILNALIVVANLIVLFTKAKVSLGRVTEVLKTDNTISYTSDERIGTPETAVEFQNVSFQYQNIGDYALENINFHLNQGETLGIIGATGSGKSTLIHLITRFYDATKGKVLVFGRDVQSYPMEELRQLISIAMQKALLFKGTIADNIRQGKQDATDEEIYQAAATAQALEFIEKKKEKFHAPVERSGKNLSGGQKQRLSIARAIVRKPKLLILDDCTSALDYATDARFRKALREYAEDLTLIIVSQRISGIRDADHILVLDDGGVAGFGNHENLMATCEKYREIVRSQESAS